MSYARALIVDDSKIARVTLKKKLEQRGLETVVAEHAQQALDLLKTEPVDVIFMDHMMPGMDGFEATRRIKANEATAHLPVIMCSGKENEDYLEQARSIGADHVLPKPTATEALDAVFEQLEHGPAIPPSAAFDAPVTAEAITEIAPTSAPAVNAANNSASDQFEEMLAPLDQYVHQLGARLDQLQDELSKQVTNASKIFEHVVALEQQSAASHDQAQRLEDELKDTLTAALAEQLDDKWNSDYLPAAARSRQEMQVALRNELGRAQEDKLDEAMGLAVTKLKSALPQPPSPAEIENLLKRSAEQKLNAIHTELQQTQQQLGAALRVELERHVNSEVAKLAPPPLDTQQLRESLVEELRSDQALFDSAATPVSAGKLPIVLTLCSTVIAGVAVALHFII